MLTRSRTTVLVASELALAGGSASGTPTSASSPKPTSDASSEVTLDPLSQYLQVDMGDFDSQTEKYESIMKQCMEAQGFDYVVAKAPAAGTAGKGGGLTSPRKWVEEHGYGVVETTFQPADHLSDLDSDPNSTYVDGLSDAQRAAYDMARDGKVADGGNPDDLDWQDKGCNGKASHEAYPQPDGTPPPILEDAQTFLGSLITDPKVTAIDAEWSTCMKDAGYPGQERRMGGKDVSFTEKASTYGAAHPDATSEDPEVVKMKADKITQALADWDCADEMHYETRFFAALGDLEKDYIAQHKAELDEAKLWLNK